MARGRDTGLSLTKPIGLLTPACTAARSNVPSILGLDREFCQDSD